MQFSQVATSAQHDALSTMRREVLEGLSQDQKSLPCKYFYDERGSQLFEQICELEEYYLTRCEVEIMERHVGEMVAGWPRNTRLIEYGSGASIKTRLLLDARADIAIYHPVDISEEFLFQTAEQLRDEYPELQVEPIVADFTRRFALPKPPRTPERTVAYFPGSTIGNFGPERARQLLAGMREMVGTGGGMLIGVDLFKSAKVLEPAYDDAEGITAEFNLNLLQHINRELDADFNLDHFTHRAMFNAAKCRMEIYLVSDVPQTVSVGEAEFDFAAGETIHTENSYKYRAKDFERLAAAAGWKLDRIWTDARGYFSVQSLRASA